MTDADDISFAEAFERQVARAPGQLAVADEADSATYGELNARANRVARALLAQSGGETLSPVALLLRPGVSALSGLLAAYKVGCPAVPLDPSHPSESLSRILRDSGATLLATDSGHRPLARAIAADASLAVLDVDALPPSLAPSNLARKPAPSSISSILYTSGSTGAPKGVFQAQRHHVWAARHQIEVLSITAEDRFLLLASAAFAASNGVFFPALLSGASIHPFPLAERGFPELAAFIDKRRITIHGSVPAVFRKLIASLPPAERLPHLRVVRLAGDTIHPSDFELFRGSLGSHCRFRATLASTEAGTIAELIVGKEARFEGPIFPCGRPLPDVCLRLIGEDGLEVPAGEIGEIEVSSPRLAGGYWKDPKLTAERFLPDPESPGRRIFRTGDLGRWRPDGYLEHRGRRDDRTKIRGFRVAPSSVEAELRRIPRIADAAVVVADGDAVGENKLVAYIVPGPGAPSDSEIRRTLAARVPAAMVPAQFVSIDALPVNDRGKIDRRALRVPVRSAAGAPVPIPPSDDLEAGLTEIWDRLFPGRVGGIESNFFELGGDSLTAAEMLAAVDRRFGRALPLPVLLDAPTIARLAEVLRAAKDECAPPSDLVALRETGSRLPFFCVPGGNGPGFNFRTICRLLGDEQPFYAFHLSADLRTALPGSIEAWAERFHAEVKRVQPRGPYRLGGHSFGGLVAVEIARHLLAEGETVEFVALLDTFAPGYPLRTSAIRQAAGLWKKFREFAWKDRISGVRRKISRQLGRGVVGIALRRYEHAPLTAPLVLFRAGSREPRPGFSYDDPDNGWRPIAGERLRTHSVPGTHDTLIEGLGAEEIARWLSVYLAGGETAAVNERATAGLRGDTDAGPSPGAS